ncbi:hydroxymethylpyrimidine/phosphomethylpyrimidine kinase [Lacrimispora sphenoides]|jgi:hydroxymethylpyrimidine kinase/phosphomethylpyrimidine kinase|uniref:bifunctional hydroxymethylpyrimidine kinase/phosphomethylpyrimidine kinase n=1 Tax=Lacrimispora sphenoides TaxID=29370 RepID=UPI0008BDF88C|nr:bifunctional hydroxymethylpyrimidine kinase/phosphomethylpyrimidine kinase [Lacrimispora sphenoides]SET93805.1 hydroxymethylpyrimidine/phosphomethylpyrimidine kinase [Lacrimispora sphenoides]
MSLILPTFLTIAGTDPSGGAGIQADLKTAAALGVYGSSVITALVAQNTTGVFLTEAVSQEMLSDQLVAVFTDIPPKAVKIGMAGTSSSIEIIAEKLEKYNRSPVVVDPVMVSTSGHSLLNPQDVKTLTSKLFPLATLVTPNIPEAKALLSTKGHKIYSRKDMEEAAMELFHIYQVSFLLKGGHNSQGADDVLCCNGTVTWFPGERIDNPNTHGTGCTLSSAIACGLALGMGLEESIRMAKSYLTGALKAGLNLGKGRGPLWHGWRT